MIKKLARLIPAPVRTEFHSIYIYKKLSPYFANFDKEDLILYSGFMKSGNTWGRLIIYNYYNLLINSNDSVPLIYSDLNSLQNNNLQKATTYPVKEGMPILYRSHAPYNKRVFSLFGKVLYIHRNPLDTLISNYHYELKRPFPFASISPLIRSKVKDIDSYVKIKVSQWVKHINSTLPHSSVSVNYDAARQNPFDVWKKVFEELRWDLDEEILKKSITMSSFENVKKLAKKTGEEAGMAQKSGFSGEFTRSGKTGQFKEALSPTTIQYVRSKFPDFDKLYGKYM